MVARRGFGRAGHAEIAEAAGVAVSTVFLSFPTRAALLDAVLEEVGRLCLDPAIRIHAQDGPCRGILRAPRLAFHASLESHPHHARIALDWSTALREALWPRYMAFVDRLVANHVRTIEGGIREGDVAPSVDPETSVRLLIGSARRTAQLRLMGSTPPGWTGSPRS